MTDQRRRRDARIRANLTRAKKTLPYHVPRDRVSGEPTKRSPAAFASEWDGTDLSDPAAVNEALAGLDFREREDELSGSGLLWRVGYEGALRVWRESKRCRPR